MKCGWCKQGREIKNPTWEQMNLNGEWEPLCTICANRRLDNPCNVLLQIRKIDNRLKDVEEQP